MYTFPELATGPYRDPLKNFPWDNNETLFQAWCEGKTGYPIVDAAMQLLGDGDLASNNGGWQWSASSGMDPKPLRIFNPASQAKKYDPDAEYIRQWLPEIRHLDTGMLISGDIPEKELEGTDYPTQIVAHTEQQDIIKERVAVDKKVAEEEEKIKDLRALAEAELMQENA